MAIGESIIDGVPGGDDSAALLDCLELLGVGVGAAAPDEVRVLGAGPDGLRPGPITLPTRLARPVTTATSEAPPRGC